MPTGSQTGGRTRLEATVTPGSMDSRTHPLVMRHGSWATKNCTNGTVFGGRQRGASTVPRSLTPDTWSLGAVIPPAWRTPLRPVWLRCLKAVSPTASLPRGQSCRGALRVAKSDLDPTYLELARLEPEHFDPAIHAKMTPPSPFDWNRPIKPFSPPTRQVLNTSIVFSA